MNKNTWQVIGMSALRKLIAKVEFNSKKELVITFKPGVDNFHQGLGLIGYQYHSPARNACLTQHENCHSGEIISHLLTARGY
jgi:hypothetical protein